MTTAPQTRPTGRFYAPEYRRQLREAGALRDLTLSEHATLGALCDRANASGTCWPSVDRIALEYGIGKTTVRESIKSLATRGLLMVVRTAGRVNTYRLTQLELTPSASGGVDPNTPRRSPTGRAPLPPREPVIPPRHPVPIMTTDHANEQEQQHHVRACEPPHENAAAAPFATLPTGETTALPAADTPVEDQSIAMLAPELVTALRTLGLAPAKVTRYGAERVRWVLERLEVERGRKAIGNPAGWVVSVLKDTVGQPVPAVLAVHAAAAGGVTSPPDGARWGRHREGGPLVELEDVNDHRVRCAGGSVIPAHHWRDWEWFTGHPDAGATVEGLNAPVAATVNMVERDPKQTAMAMLAVWMMITPRTPDQVAAKLESRGLTPEDWEAYQAARGIGG